MKELLTLGTLIKPVGLLGEIKIVISTHFPDDRFSGNYNLFLSNNGKDLLPVSIESYRLSSQFAIIKFKEMNSIEEVSKYINCQILAYKDDLQLDKNEYFFSDLMNCNVYDQNNNLLGQVIEINEYPSQVNITVKKMDNKTFNFPFIKEFVSKVDILKKEIHIIVIEGLL